ncbi:MAG: hypothetical protein QE269_08700 [Fimbriimonas sp.]|nr:hypothetical protein [Fimbriimonas sp.]
MKAVLSVGFAILCAIGLSQGAPAQVNAEKLAKLKKTYETAKAASVKKPKDTKLKKAYEDAALGYGLGCMYSELPPREKYVSALRYLRETVKINPKNKVANEQIKMIEDIYKQMGRPVPKTD